MKIGFTKLIAENIAPPNVKSIAIYNGEKKVGTVDISKMNPSNIGEKLYSFGLLSDVHCSGSDNPSDGTKLDNALNYFKSQGVSLCCISGDLTDIGFWYPVSETDGTSYYNPFQFDEYISICGKYDFPVYACCGNHESYNGYDVSNTSRLDTYGSNPTVEINTLSKLVEYLGDGLVFTKTHGNDVFIFVGQSTQNEPLSYEHFVWLGETLEANKNKRCFVFVHPYVDSSDSGNPNGLHRTPLFNSLSVSNHGFDKSMFIDLMASYPNAILFHGHSHFIFDTQKQVENANYSTALGFRSVHVPSTSYCRDIVDGSMVNVGESLGYLVDVYENHIVLKGYDFIKNDVVPIAQYCIDTTLQTVV